MRQVEPRRRAADPLVEPRSYCSTPDWHVHDFSQVLFGLHGRAELEMNGHLYRTRALRGVIVPAGCRHDFAGDAVNCQLVVDLPIGSVAVPQALLDKPQEFAVPPQLDRALCLALANGVRQQRQHDWLLAVEAISVVGRLLTDMACDAVNFPVRRIETFLRCHMGHPVSTAELAAQFGWKPRRFHDLFCEAFGDTPQQYQSRLRLDRAVQLLSDQKLALAEIADRLGYSDQQSFTHRFSVRFGLPPGKWRSSS
ncbi:AraC family transcriptional regulator [Crenobacter sp. SG2303]|uniref:AraC family transcriptional regulator n=1 Tax=Crenobacter oryzisoli TaxID=3056844 RepID=A0ABT7XI84_9NEIS|nr:AraC family transcriptional regulator [Crenobacter sp. SG2303]MDN0073499.1 AraC family transcriptional regulator [Crenobacter sp. SG2303]